jgi:hypothetical protein
MPEPAADQAAKPASGPPAGAAAATPAGPRTSLRLVGFVAGLVLALVGGFGIGRAVGDGPATSAGAVDPTHSHTPGASDDPGGHAHGSGAATAGNATVSGLAMSDAAFRLEVESTTFRAGRAQPLRFQIRDALRRPVTAFTVQHEKPLHLIVARRDLSGFQHLHPTMAPDGTWTVPLTLPTAGVWRAYADFTATTADGTSAAAVLGVDLTVPGDYRPAPLPPPAPQAVAADYQVRYQGRPRVAAVQPLLFTVTRAGAPVQVEPYLGAYGHLVVLRQGDLGYVHAHAEPQLAGGAMKFWFTAPSPGRYRMFLDFQAAGAVHTAEFTLAVG